MKRLLPLFLILCLLLSGCGGGYEGETVTRQVVTAMESDTWLSGEFEGIHTINQREYGYDEYGRKVYEKWIVDGETVFSSRFHWSGDGRECTEVTWDHQGLIPWPESRVKEVYDENGNEILQIVYEFWAESQRSDSTYDEKGNLIHLEVTDSDGNTTIVQDYTYDEKGNRLKTIDRSGDGAERITEYAYDEAGNQTGWQYYEDGVLQEYVETFYDDQGRKTFSARYDAEEVQKHYWEYSYSADGSSMTTSYSGERSTTDYYGESGLLIRSESRDGDGILTSISTYTYETIQVPKEPNP